MSVATCRMRRRLAPLSAALVCAALLIGLWHATAMGPARSRPPRLLVRGSTQVLMASLEGGVRLRGTLYPALPGRNTLRVMLGGGTGGGAAGTGPLEMSITMPGMAMRPLRATLHGQAGRYRGTVVLPMFGTYLAHVLLATPRGQRQGTLRLDVPLDLSP